MSINTIQIDRAELARLHDCENAWKTAFRAVTSNSDAGQGYLPEENSAQYVGRRIGEMAQAEHKLRRLQNRIKDRIDRFLGDLLENQ